MHQLHQNVGEDDLGTVTKLENLTLHQLHQNMGEDDLARVTKIQSLAFHQLHQKKEEEGLRKVNTPPHQILTANSTSKYTHLVHTWREKVGQIWIL